jgi:superfamily I DNA/RNA helicase
LSLDGGVFGEAEGGDASAVLVVVANGLKTQPMLQALARELGEGSVVDAKEAGQTNAIRVCGLDAATGLEAPIVFVVGAAELLEAEDDLQLSREQRGELRRDNTRRLYMAFTRAGQRLFITWTGKEPFGCP